MKIETPIAAEAPLQPVDTFFSAGRRTQRQMARAERGGERLGVGEERRGRAHQMVLRLFNELSPYRGLLVVPRPEPACVR